MTSSSICDALALPAAPIPAALLNIWLFCVALPEPDSVPRLVVAVVTLGTPTEPAGGTDIADVEDLCCRQNDLSSGNPRLARIDNATDSEKINISLRRRLSGGAMELKVTARIPLPTAGGRKDN